MQESTSATYSSLKDAHAHRRQEAVRKRDSIRQYQRFGKVKIDRRAYTGRA